MRRHRAGQAPSWMILAALFLSTAGLFGCDADCRTACKKLIRECDYAEPGYGVDQCEAECQVQKDALAEEPGSETQSAAFQDQLNCIRDAECSALTDPADPNYPACYDDDVFSF